MQQQTKNRQNFEKHLRNNGDHLEIPCRNLVETLEIEREKCVTFADPEDIGYKNVGGTDFEPPTRASVVVRSSRTLHSLNKCGTFCCCYACSNGHFSFCKNTCQNIYCKKSHCISVRISRKKKILTGFKIKSQRLYHFTVGFPQFQYAEIKRVLKKWRDIFFKKYKIYAVASYDISPTGFFHFHILALPNRLFNQQNTKNFIKEAKATLSKATKGKLTEFNNIGYKPKKSLFNYFSKRLAGVYGHKKEGYTYLADLITFEEYMINFHKKRRIITNLTRRLVYTKVCMCGEDGCNLPLKLIYIEKIEPLDPKIIEKMDYWFV